MEEIPGTPEDIPDIEDQSQELPPLPDMDLKHASPQRRGSQASIILGVCSL